MASGTQPHPQEHRATPPPSANGSSDTPRPGDVQTCVGASPSPQTASADDDSQTACPATDGKPKDDARHLSIIPLRPGEILTLTLPPDFKSAHEMLYAALRQPRRDADTLQIAAEAIRQCRSSPSAWLLRRQSADALAKADKSVYQRELSFTTGIIAASRKNYQAWEHRRHAASQAGLLDAEQGFCDLALDEDAKNYHAWSHRAWLVRRGHTRGELEATEWFIRADVRNNSAWNHRWLVTGVTGRERETDFVLEMVKVAPRNESAWNYALALSRVGVGRDAARACAAACVRRDTGCVPARRFLVLTGGAGDADDVAAQCEALAACDAVRARYWRAQQRAAEEMARGK